MNNRGAGQGEPEGPLKTAVVLGEIDESMRLDMSADGRRGGASLWYVDDGQIFSHPMAVDGILRELDKRLAEAGATRGSISKGHEIKSTVCAWIPAGCEAECEGWLTLYVLDTCKEVQPLDPHICLGVMLGEQQAVSGHFEGIQRKVEELHKAIEEISDPAVELVLKKECADVAKVTNLLRTSGDRLENEAPGWDAAARASLSRSLIGEVAGHAWTQATSGEFEFPGMNPTSLV